jgi:repressor LexA
MGYQKGEDRLHKALDFIIRFQQKNGYPPHVRELCDGVGIKSPSHAHKLLDQLEQRDLIAREENKSRAIRVLDAAYEFLGQMTRRMEEALTIPVLGKIVASAPIPMPESDFPYYDAESTVSIPYSTLANVDKSRTLFALEVQGDSMIDSMVNDGDTVILRRTQEVDNGDMVAVWMNDRQATTLKHFYRKNGKIILRPANPNYPDIDVENPAELEIRGKVVMVIRQY